MQQIQQVEIKKKKKNHLRSENKKGEIYALQNHKKTEKFNTRMFLFEDTKVLFRRFISRKTDNTMVKRKSTTTINKTLHRKDRATRTPLKPGGELVCSRIVSSLGSTCGITHTEIITIFSKQKLFSLSHDTIVSPRTI